MPRLSVSLLLVVHVRLEFVENARPGTVVVLLKVRPLSFGDNADVPEAIPGVFLETVALTVFSLFLEECDELSVEFTIWDTLTSHLAGGVKELVEVPLCRPIGDVNVNLSFRLADLE